MVDDHEPSLKRERVIRFFFLFTASISILVLSMILFFLFMEGLPIFGKVSVTNFLFGREWYPTSSPPDFGIFPLLVASMAVTVLSALISIPLGVMTAIYLAEIASARVREIVKPVVELLAALPSVVIGFFGMVVVAPFLQDTFDIATGLNLFNASLMLAFMSVPTICSISEDAIHSVPIDLKEASLALGATHWETIFRVILPASLSGISTAVILGMSRAIGETMVVLMVAGGAGHGSHIHLQSGETHAGEHCRGNGGSSVSRRPLSRSLCHRHGALPLHAALQPGGGPHRPEAQTGGGRDAVERTRIDTYAAHQMQTSSHRGSIEIVLAVQLREG